MERTGETFSVSPCASIDAYGVDNTALILPYELVCLPAPGDRMGACDRTRLDAPYPGAELPSPPPRCAQSRFFFVRRTLFHPQDVDANEISIAMVFNNTAVE